MAGRDSEDTMSEIRRVLQKVREGKLKRLITELLWMYAYVRKYWLLIGVYILLGASGSVLSLGTSVVSRDLVDAVTGVNSAEIIQVAVVYVGVGVSQIFINAVKTSLSLRVRLKVTNEIRSDIYQGMSLNRPVAEWNGWILSTRQSGKKPLWMLFRFPEPLN